MEPNRALRRFRTRRVAHHRLLQHAHSWLGNPNDLMKQEPLRFAKVHPLNCPCRKRYKGHPRNGGPGMCKTGVRWEHYRHRVKARQVAELSRNYRVMDWESDETILLAEPGRYSR